MKAKITDFANERDKVVLTVECCYGSEVDKLYLGEVELNQVEKG